MQSHRSEIRLARPRLQRLGSVALAVLIGVLGAAAMVHWGDLSNWGLQ